MYTTFAFLTKNPALTTEEFITYYETKHVPLINHLAGPENQPLVYKRRYTHRDDPAHVRVRAKVDASGVPIGAIANSPTVSKAEADSKERETDPSNVDFDVITEVGFADQAAQKRWFEALAKGGDAVPKDEERFLWRERTRAVVVQEFVSFDEPRKEAAVG